jgi:hypothetical protein
MNTARLAKRESGGFCNVTPLGKEKSNSCVVFRSERIVNGFKGGVRSKAGERKARNAAEAGRLGASARFMLFARQS